MAHSQPWEELIESLPLPERPENLTIQHKLNKGAWGMVYAGVFDGRQVAVKAVHDTLVEGVEGGDITVRNFCKECDRLKALEHNHVIKFLGAFKDPMLGPILVMEKMKETLRQFLKKSRGKLTVHKQLCISLDITRGVAFLHQLIPPMVHRDLNDNNVMFSSEGVAKIGDFGQSKLKQDLYLTSAQPGMVAFMPPEALQVGNSKYDESLDMFSLGVLMLEIGTQEQPTNNVVGIGTTVEVKRRKADLERMSHFHPLKPSILCCLRDDPKLRLKASELLVVLPVLFENLHESQQEVARLKRTQQELEGAQQAHTRTHRELNKTRQELEGAQQAHARTHRELNKTRQELEGAQQAHTRTSRELNKTQQVLEGVQQEHTRTQQELEGVQQEHTSTRQDLSKTRQQLQGIQQELQKVTSAVQKLSDNLSAKETCLEVHHANQKLSQADAEAGNCVTVKESSKMDSGIYKNRSENQHKAQNMMFERMAISKDEELIRMRDMMGSKLHCMPKDEGQWKVDELYLNVQERSTIQQTTIDTIVHTLEDHIQDLVESAEFTEGSQMYMACERYSEGYKNWALGYEIILCSVLQLCYEMCTALLAHKVAHEAVRAYKDGRSFAPEVVTMLQNSLAEEDHAVLEDVATCLVANGLMVQAQAQQNDSKKYMAVYSLITAYLDITPEQDYIASAKRDILADEVLKVATGHSCVEAFVDKVLPLCWRLVTMFVPPILTCDQKVKVNGAHHDLSHMSSEADTVQSYLFPVVWYGGDVHRKARVLAEKFK